MQIDWIDINQLNPHPKNPNQHSQEQIDRLCELIKYQGWRHPIIVSKLSGYIVAGHGRLSAAKQLNESKVPVHYQDFETDEQEYAFLVSDNAISQWAFFDFSQINSEIPNLGPDFDINLLGLKNFQLDPSELDSGDDWNGMPEFNQEDASGLKLLIHFESEEAVRKLGELIGQDLSINNKNRWIKSIWFPKRERESTLLDNE